MNTDFELVRRALAAPSPPPYVYPEAAGGEPAAVLALVREAPLSVVLHVRAASLREHAGELALPGGRRDAGDASLLATALRETREEFGIDPGDVEPVGELLAVPVITGKYSIHPFVGLTRAVPRAASPEIERLVEMDLEPYLAGRAPVFYRLEPWRGSVVPTPFFRLPSGDVPYGATAAVIADLLQRLSRALGCALELRESRDRPWGDRYAREGG
ncbi:MAG: CoA pyrophosphatase [Polyangiaceae bacterium]|nr:CoA pyrophosphatase [Polyangiaceae bacterium]